MSSRQPSIEEAESALYIDFEGTAVDPPSLLGVRWSHLGIANFKQYVVEERLWPVAAAATAGTPNSVCTPARLVDALNEVRALAEDGRYRLYAWTNHDLDCIRDVSPDKDLTTWYEASLENARPIARRWRRRFHPDVTFSERGPRNRPNALANYLRLIEYDVPKAFGPGNSAKRIRDVRQMLVARGGGYDSLTPVAKAKWTKALKHNWYDCDGLRTLVCRVAAQSQQLD